MASPASPARSGSAEGLRPDAPTWEPSQAPRRENSVRPIRTAGRQRSDVLATLDAIPFTPSQGVCTPSPTNMAQMWLPHPFFQGQAWTAMAYSTSPGPSSGGSDSSLMHTGSQPGTPGGGMYGAPAAVMWSGFCQPLPYSPTALQIAAASGALGSDPSTPVRGRPGSAGASAAAAAAAGAFVMPGSPVVLSPGQMMFAQYFGADGAARSSKQRSHSPPESKDSGSAGSGSDGEGSDGMSSHGSGGVEVSEAAHQIASAMCAAQQLPGDPPQQLLELASLLHAYGLVSAVSAFPPAAHPAAAPSSASASGAPLSPDSRRQQYRQRQKTVPKLNPDGSVRLNARQRRTLRRAQERAMKALMDAQTRVHGISSEQAASNLASMGVASILLGSPPQAPAPAMHSPLPHMPPHGAYMAPPLSPLPGMPAAMMAGHMGMQGVHPHEFGMMHGMQAGMAAVSGMFDGYAGVHGGGGDMLGMGYGGMPGHGTQQQQRGRGSPGGGGYGAGMRGTPGSAGYRPGGGGRMSRFAPADAAVAAF